MKGISTLIATILLVVITIALATVVYFYSTGIITGKTSDSFSILSVNGG